MQYKSTPAHTSHSHSHPTGKLLVSPVHQTTDAQALLTQPSYITYNLPSRPPAPWGLRYTIAYNCVDANGLAASPATRSVRVDDFDDSDCLEYSLWGLTQPQPHASRMGTFMLEYR